MVWLYSSKILDSFEIPSSETSINLLGLSQAWSGARRAALYKISSSFLSGCGWIRFLAETLFNIFSNASIYYYVNLKS